METYSGIPRLLLALLLQLLPAQMFHIPELAPTKVMQFLEVVNKSVCRPMEQLVDVDHVFPGEVEYTYKPSLVSLWRCSGCCWDETMDCYPTLERNTTLQVLRIDRMMSHQCVEVTFVEHQNCECRVRPDLQIEQSTTESITHRPRKRKHKKTTNGCENCHFPQNKINHH